MIAADVNLFFISVEVKILSFFISENIHEKILQIKTKLNIFIILLQDQ